MSTYVVRRLLLIPLMLLIVATVVFVFIRMIPGDAVELMVAEMGGEATVWGAEVTEDLLRQELGLDVPVHVQFGRWITNIVRGDLGVAIWTRIPVRDLIAQALPVSLELGFLSICFSVVIGVPVGVFSALRQDTMPDYIMRSIAIALIVIPAFWLATLVWVYPSIWWNWIPPLRYIDFLENPMGNLKQFLIPAAISGMLGSGIIMRMTRTMMLEVLRQDYIRTAWAKGLRESVVVLRHGLKNALMPIVTIIGLRVAVVIGGLVVLESIFNLPGMGAIMLRAIQQRDYPVISGVNLVIASFIVLVSVLVDLTYAYLDPRVRYK